MLSRSREGERRFTNYKKVKNGDCTQSHNSEMEERGLESRSSVLVIFGLIAMASPRCALILKSPRSPQKNGIQICTWKRTECDLCNLSDLRSIL